MPYFDDELHHLSRQVIRERQLDAMLRELKRQYEILTDRVRELEKVCAAQQADVERLEGRSLAAFYYYVIGKKDEMLDKERREAYAARVKYDTARRELEGVERDMDLLKAEQLELQGCEERYHAAMEQKVQAVTAAGGTMAEQILALVTRRTALEHQRRELSQAIAAGRTALDTTEQILASLSSAEDWGTFDLLGGGVVADVIKHSSLDDAQKKVELLQSQLRRFQTELADVEIRADMRVTIDGFLRFADYFFDGLFSDWTVMEEIQQSQVEVENTRNQIQTALDRLEAMERLRTQECRQVQDQIDGLVLEAQV